MPPNVTEFSLRQEDARLAFLAVAYHLGRPGSEFDPITKQPVEHGLAEVARDLQPQLRLAVATLALNKDQITRLMSGMAGSVTELKAYPMLALRGGGGRMSTVPGFDGTLRHLFPEVEEDIDQAMEIARRMLMLRRRLTSEIGNVPAPGADATLPQSSTPKRSWWPFRR